MKKIYIFGSGGFGREVLWLIQRINDRQEKQTGNPEWEIAGFIDDNTEMHGKFMDDIEVVAGSDYLIQQKEDVYVTIAVGSAKVRKNIAEKLGQYPNIHFATLIDPSVILSERIEIGKGCILCAGTIATVDIKIGNHVIINLDCTLGHDDVLKDYVTVYPSVNISGNVTVGQESELGTGSHIIQGKQIAQRSIVGAGSVVIRDIPSDCVAVGNPAKPIKFLEEN